MVKRTLRFIVALVGGFVALYLLFLMPVSLLRDTIEVLTAGSTDSAWVGQLAAFAAALCALRYATQYVRGRRSLERLWTFVIVVHLLTYVVLYPYFHVVNAGRLFQDLLVKPMDTLMYYGVGYSLLALAAAAAYLLVYRDGYPVAKQRLLARLRGGPAGR